MKFISAGKHGDLVFVVDVTGSMVPEIKQLKAAVGTLHRMGVVVNRLQTFFDRFVLVTVNDPTIKSYSFKSFNKFADTINRLRAHGGGDCPEPLYKGLQRALSISRRHSMILLFTDASPKYPALFTSTKRLALAKRVRINIFAFGSCGKRFAARTRVFYSLSKLTLSSYYITTKKSISLVRSVNCLLNISTVSQARTSFPTDFQTSHVHHQEQLCLAVLLAERLRQHKNQ